MLAADAAAAGLALAAATAVSGHPASMHDAMVSEAVVVAGAPLLWIGITRACARPGDRPLDTFPRLLPAASVFSLTLSGAAGLLGAQALSTGVAIMAALVLAVATASLRGLAARLLGHARRRERTVVVGGGEVGCALASRARAGHVDLDVLGIVDDRRPIVPGSAAWLGPAERLEDLAVRLRADRVVVADADPQVADALGALLRRGVRVDLVPPLHAALPLGSTGAELGGFPIVGVRAPAAGSWSRMAARAVDIAVAAGALVALSPVMLAAAVAIRLDSPGPVFFRQRRIGRGGRDFSLWKFRSMCDGADARKAEVRHLNDHADRADDRMFKAASDPRVTRVGGLLRRTSLDELPQLLNVLRGDMSLVGPRPLIPCEDEHVAGADRCRSVRRPGITGLWQISGRSDLTFSEMLALDRRYVAGWTLWRDVEILLRTVPVMVLRRGAY